MAGPLNHRLETMVDEDDHQLITVRAERLAGIAPGGRLPYGFRGKAARSLWREPPSRDELREATRRADQVRSREME